MVTKPVLRRSAFHKDGLLRLREMPLVPLSVEGFDGVTVYKEYTKWGMTGLRFQVVTPQ